MLRGEITLMRVADASRGPETACLVRRQAWDPRQSAWILRNVTGQQREMPAVPLVEAEKGALSSAAQPDSGRLSAQHSEKFRFTTWGNSLIQGFAPFEKLGTKPFWCACCSLRHSVTQYNHTPNTLFSQSWWFPFIWLRHSVNWGLPGGTVKNTADNPGDTRDQVWPLGG